MFITSDLFALSPARVHGIVSSYLNFEENSLRQLMEDGILVNVTYSPADGSIDGFRAQFCERSQKDMYSEIVAELKYEEAVEHIQNAIIDSDIANSEVGLPSSHPGLWELIESRTLPLDRLYGIAIRNGWA